EVNMDEITSIFDETRSTEKEIVEEEYDYGQRIINEIENDYKGLGSAKEEREKEKKDITEKIKTLKNKLRKMKNVKNHRLTKINKDISTKRKGIKGEIEKLKDRLHDIAEEEKGSAVTSETLMEASRETTPF